MAAPTNAAHALALDAALCFQSFEPLEFQRQYEAHVKALDDIEIQNLCSDFEDEGDVPELEQFDDDATSDEELDGDDDED